MSEGRPLHRAKPSSDARSAMSIAAPALVALLGVCQQGLAATYYWDSNGNTAGLGAVSGTWNGTAGTSNWNPNSVGGDGVTGGPSGTIVTTTADTLIFNSGSGTCTVVGTVNAAIFQLGSGSGSNVQLSGGIIDNGGATTTFAMSNGSGMTISSVVQGGGGLTKSTGTSVTLTLIGANTYSGTTTITNGILRLGNGGTTGTLSTSSAIVTNANFTINRSNAVLQGTDFSGSAITGSGSFTKAGSGTTTLTAANAYLGATTISAGILQLGNGATTGSLSTSSAITNNANLTINRTNAVSQGTDFSSAAITGTGSFTQAGAGITTLTASNAYVGGTTVSAGTLLVNNTTGSGTGGGAVNVTGGTFGGNGIIVTAGNAGVTLAASAKLAPGASAGMLTMDLGAGVLDISGAVTALNTQALKFELDALDDTNDKVVLPNASSVLNIGSGVLEFDDFAFSDLGGLEVGAYTLFDTGTTIVGSFGTTLSGPLGGGKTGTIGFGDTGNDVVLTVVPEPATLGVIGAGAIGLLARRRVRKG